MPIFLFLDVLHIKHVFVSSTKCMPLYESDFALYISRVGGSFTTQPCPYPLPLLPYLPQASLTGTHFQQLSQLGDICRVCTSLGWDWGAKTNRLKKKNQQKSGTQ